MIVPQLEQWIAGEEPDEETFNTRIRDVMEFLLEPPFASATGTAPQSIPNVTWTVVDLNTTRKDNDGIVNLTTNQFVITTPGWYEVVYQMTLNASPFTGRRIVALRLNGAGVYRGRTDALLAQTGTPEWVSGGHLHCLFLNVDDTLELMAYQETGAAVSTFNSTECGFRSLQVRWVSN